MTKGVKCTYVGAQESDSVNLHMEKETITVIDGTLFQPKTLHYTSYDITDSQ